MSKWIHNEEGNITLLTLGLLGVMALMFAVLLNLVKVFAVKQQAANAAEQASLAATAEIYRVVEEAIDDIPEPFQTTLEEQIEMKKIQLESHYAWSDREFYLEAVDQVLAEKLANPLDPAYLLLKTGIESGLYNDKDEILDAAAVAITSDGGALTGTQIKIDSQYRVEVRTSSIYRAYKYDDLIPEDKRQIYQVGKGPELAFLRYVQWTI